MSFLAPSLLLGLLAAALPALIHLIGKRRATPVRFAAMQLLLRAERRVSARRRLREILLLVARTAIAAALPLVFARPFTERPSDLPEDSLTAGSAVVVLDDSASMRRSRDGLFEAAQSRAQDLLRQLPPVADVALVLASAGSEPPVAELTNERGRLHEAVAVARPSARVADYDAALRRAALILGTSTRPERRIFVLTDLQAAGWPETSPLPPGGPDVVLVDVARGRPWENRAVLSVTATPVAEAGTGGVAVDAEIANFSKEDVRALVTLRIDDAEVAKGFVDLPAGGRATKRFLPTLAGGGGAHDVAVSIDADDFPLDDRRFARLELSRTLRVVVVNGDSRTIDREDEAFFVERALRASDRATTVTTVVPDDVTAATLAGANVVFLANVGDPSPALAAALVRFVEGGGGLFLSVGNRVDPFAWNDRLGKLLPQPLSVARTASALPGQSAGETVDTRPAETLAPLDRRHPLLAAFPAEGEGISSARFFKLMLLEPAAGSNGHTVILRFGSGAPALVERAVGKGRVMLLCTTIDREWTDLPIRPGFLPLVQESARRLAGASDSGGAQVLLAGEPRELAFGADDRRFEVTKPDGSVWVGNRPSGSATRTIVFSETQQLGAYHVSAAGGDGQLAPRPADGFVVNVDPRESDPKVLPEDRRPTRPAAAAAGAPPKRRIELWHGLAGLIILFVLVESLLTIRWRRAVVAQSR